MSAQQNDLLSETDRMVNEGSSQTYTLTLKDGPDGDPIELTDLESLTLTFYDVDSGDVINGREGQDVLNSNDCTFHATSGLFTWEMQPEDNVLVSYRGHGKTEQHRIELTAVTTGGRQFTYCETFEVVSLLKFGG